MCQDFLLKWITVHLWIRFLPSFSGDSKMVCVLLSAMSKTVIWGVLVGGWGEERQRWAGSGSLCSRRAKWWSQTKKRGEVLVFPFPSPFLSSPLISSLLLCLPHPSPLLRLFCIIPFTSRLSLLPPHQAKGCCRLLAYYGPLLLHASFSPSLLSGPNGKGSLFCRQ